MSDFLSRVESILSGVMNFNPKSRVERLLMKWVGSVGNVEDLETYDKSSVVAAINEIAKSGGGEVKRDLEQLQTGVVACLNDIKILLSNATYVDYDANDMLAQLAEDIEDLGSVVPEEPIAITFDGTTAKISGLNSLNINYSGTTVEIGG